MKYICICCGLFLCICILETRAIRLCGDLIPETLSSMCNGAYNGQDAVDKRYLNEDGKSLVAFPQFSESDSVSDPKFSESSTKILSSPKIGGMLTIGGRRLVNKSPFLNTDTALSFLQKREIFNRVTRGIYDECCLKSCSFREVLSYCAMPAPSTNVL